MDQKKDALSNVEKGEDESSVLMKTVVELTGLPEKWVNEELEGYLKQNGHSRKNLTLDQLREVLLNYLESIQSEIQTQELESAPPQAH